MNLACFIISVNPNNRNVYQLTSNLYQKLGYKNIEIVFREKDPFSGKKGCFESHQYLCKQIVERRYDYALILEEDAMLKEDSFDFENAIMDVLQNDPDFDVICLASTFGSHQIIRQIGNHVYQVHGFGETLSYVVSKKGAKAICSFQFNGVPYDHEFELHNDMHLYVIRPSAFIPSFSYASNVADHIDVKYYLTQIGLGYLVQQERIITEKYNISSKELLMYILGFFSVVLLCIINYIHNFSS